MGEAISAILPQALGAAISPVAIIAVILMLFTAKARVNAPIFTLGWAAGLLVVAAIAYVIGDRTDVSIDEDASNWAFILKVALGVLLILMALKQWRGRPKEGDPQQPPPKWMQGIDQFTPVKAFGLGALLGGPNRKNLLLSVAAGTTVAQLGASTGSSWAALIVYVLIGTLPVGGPVAYYFAAGKQAENNLNDLKAWLAANNATVMVVLFAIFGMSLLSDGLQGIFA